MSTTTVSSKRDNTVSASREALRESVIFPIIRETGGIIAEVVQRKHSTPIINRFEDAAAYEMHFKTNESSPDEQALLVDKKADIAIWLFGPEREVTPSEVLRTLSESVSTDGAVIIASEVPWPGKILASDECGEYTKEETAAMLIRAGFHEIETVIEGPFFRITKAKKCPGNAYRSLIEAEQCLDKGNFVQAEVVLNSLSEQMQSVEMVREYALLVAACHDLAGRHDPALEALSEALTLDPRCARAMCGLGRIAAIKGDLATAKDFFESALDCEPALVAGLHGMAVIQEARGEMKAAYRSMTIASDLRPSNENLLSDAARLGNAVGELNDVAHLISHRLGKSTVFEVYGLDTDGPSTTPRPN
jgi:Flp pilus assembly protein TadD